MMKVYYNASLTGKQAYEKNYRLINKAIEDTGAQIVKAPVFGTEKTSVMSQVIKTGKTHFVDYYTNLQKWIKQADICVFEVSYSSTSIGHEIAMALHGSKPVIALRVSDAPRNIILNTINDSRLQLVDYSPADVNQVVCNALEYANGQLDQRFTLIMPASLISYLDSVSTQGVSRSEYIRNLIRKDILDKNT